MKTLTCIIAFIFLTAGIQAQDKKEIKQLSKKYNLLDKGPYKKAKRVVIVGNNIRFRIAAHQSETNSWKDDKSYKFGAYAVLKGVDDQLMKDIAQEYHQMLVAKFNEMGIEVVPYNTLTTAKNYPKFYEKYIEEPYNGTKGWGAAVIYNYDNHDFLAWHTATPFGPQTKLAKELDALLYNSQVTVDFCRIGIDVEQYKKGNPSLFAEGGIYTEGKASVVPEVFVQHYTYNPQGTKMNEDNTYSISLTGDGKLTYLILNTNPSNIHSGIAFATQSKLCKGCMPQFAKGKIRLSESNMGTVEITANPQLYKKAVLEVLQQYLDETFLLYSQSRN